MFPGKNIDLLRLCISNRNKILVKRNLFTSCMIMEKALKILEENPYFEKYAEKISKLQKTSPEEFQSRSENVVQQSIATSSDAGKNFSKVAEKGKSALPSAAYAFAPQKKLESVMKTELIKDKTADEIKYIWTQHFMKKDAISGVMPAELFDKLQDRAVEYPTFLFPLPRDQGYEFIYAQFASNEIHFTPLINYQAYQENAPECLTMVHYTELSNDKKIVLMVGEFNKDIINSKDAQFLANEVMLYYGGDDREKLDLVHKFHKCPNTFKHIELINQIEKLDLGLLAQKK